MYAVCEISPHSHWPAEDEEEEAVVAMNNTRCYCSRMKRAVAPSPVASVYDGRGAAFFVNMLMMYRSLCACFE